VEASEAKVDQLQRELESEKADRDSGLANNVTRVQKQLALAKEHQEEALKIQKKAVEEQAILERRLQTISLITATANIIKVASNAGPIGIAAAAVSIAAMWALFFDAQKKARETTQGFSEGVIDLQGAGTTKSDSIPANLSKRESVMTADETIKYGDVFRAIRAKNEGLALYEMEKVINPEKYNNLSVQLDQSKFDKSLDKLGNPSRIENGYRIQKKGNCTYRIKI